MSAVTLQEIADLVAERLRVPLAEMRGVGRDPGRNAETRRVRDARDVVVILAWRHTGARMTQIIVFFGLSTCSPTYRRLSDVIERAEGWLNGNPDLAHAVEEIEQQIDALHERRLALRDRKVVRV
ncbi:MAG: hypothetical protein AB7S70_02560 [Hyphomicrobium sp.]|uniref:hypothetical protein n=1 Tax=Hyphomicrobium sp. TaxID=82 RepID=UPI003D11554B